MGITAATLQGHRVTSARVNVPAWGAWYADVSIDGEVTLSGRVDLVVADTTFRGAVLSGGASKGRSDFRLVGGAAGWGKTIPAQSYANDAGVKLATVLGDAASLVGETLDLGARADERIGPAYVRPEGPASRVLEELAPSAWYIGEDGVTHLGRRAAGALPAGVTHGVVDVARGTVTLASEVIAAITPGLVVDGLAVVDVLHILDTKTGLRSTVWGKHGGSSRRLEAWRTLSDQLDPDRRFRGVTEYRVVAQTGERYDLQAVRVSTGMPDLRRVPAWPGVSGVRSDVVLGSRVLVGFADSDPARPVVLGFEDADGEGFIPTHLDLAGGTEHLMTTEACALLIYNVLSAMLTAVGPPGTPLPANTPMQALITPAIIAAIGAQAAPAPPTAAAQVIAAGPIASSMTAGATPSNSSAPFAAAILAGVAGKTADDSGLFPSVGAKNVRTA